MAATRVSQEVAIVVHDNPNVKVRVSQVAVLVFRSNSGSGTNGATPPGTFDVRWIPS